jgi:hypothetical protein
MLENNLRKVLNNVLCRNQMSISSYIWSKIWIRLIRFIAVRTWFWF